MFSKLCVESGGGTAELHKVIMSFQMQFFVFLSGYCASYSLPITDTYQFLKKKIRGLLIPYLSWVTVGLVIGILQGKSLLGTSIVEAFIYSGFWFLRVLLYVFVVLAIQQYFLKRLKNKYIISWCISFAVAFIATKLPGCGNLWKHYLWFTFGICVQYMMKMVPLPRMRYIEVACYIGAIICLPGVVFLENTKLAAIIDIGASGFGTLGLYFICKRAYAVLASCYAVKFICKIGQMTLGLYAIHWCLLFSTGWGNFTSAMRTVIENDWVIALVMMCVWTGLSVIIWNLLNVTKTTRALFLGRS